MKQLTDLLRAAAMLIALLCILCLSIARASDGQVVFTSASQMAGSDRRPQRRLASYIAAKLGCRDGD